MEIYQEVEEASSKIQALREMVDHPGWRLLAARLGVLLRQKEVEKSKALREGLEHLAIKHQFVIDGIYLVMDEPTKIISSLTPSEAEEL